MVEDKAVLLLAVSILATGTAAGLDFQVNVAPTPELSLYQPDTIQEEYFNATVSLENPGSVGCKVRIKGEIKQGEKQLTRYSPAYRLWPGEITRAEFLYLPLNYTGEVEANLSAVYCEQEEQIGSYSFNSTKRRIPNQTIKSKTLEVNSSSAKVSFRVGEALLIPQEYPPYWKVGSEKINGGDATISYEPALFKKGETITYTVVQEGEIAGETEVVLEEQEKWYEELVRRIISTL